MARSVNKAILIGNLGADPDVRTVGSGTKVANFRLATSRQWPGRDGQMQEKTEWHNIVVWGANPEKDGAAGVVERYLKKGERVYVEGQIEYRSYEDKDGQEKWITEVVVRPFNGEINLLGGRGEGDASERGSSERSSSRGSNNHSRKPQPAAAGAKKGNANYDDFEEAGGGAFEDDDLPF